jgi:DnaJ-class molecular chaperone
MNGMSFLDDLNERKPTKCLACDGGTFAGDGRCSKCHGSGVNLNLASDVPGCLFCNGTGVCANCGGSGLYPPDEMRSDIHTLFGG